MSRPLTILLTGFEPFGGEPVNPAEQLVRAVAARTPLHARLQLVPVVLPVDRLRLSAHLDAVMAASRPDAVVAVGQSTGRPRIDLELRAVNHIDYGGATDNGGHGAHEETLAPEGPPELATTLPWSELHAALRDEGHPVGLSQDAGRHLCNALLYDLLLRHPTTPAGFVHVPLLRSQSERRGQGEPHLDADVSERCLTSLLTRLADLLGAAGPS